MNDRISQRTQQNAAPRLSQEQEYRNYLLQQQGLANGNVNTAFGNQLTNNNQTGNLINQATQGMSQYDLGRRGQSFGTNFKGAFGTALGGFLGNPSKALRPGA